MIAAPPRATARLQLHAGFTLDDACAALPYLVRLGISHVYASPLLAARPGSAHGYDVIDPTRIDLFGVNYNLKTAKGVTFEDGTVPRFGFLLGYSQSTLNSAQLLGSWAVTG